MISTSFSLCISLQKLKIKFFVFICGLIPKWFEIYDILIG